MVKFLDMNEAWSAHPRRPSLKARGEGVHSPLWGPGTVSLKF